MSSIRRMTAEDILSLNLTNLDPLTENYDLNFYLQYLMEWPSLFNVVQDRNGSILGYIMGKTEEQPPELKSSPHYTPWHGHVTALTVAPAWRRLGYASRLTESLERASDSQNAWFVDLYVRASNKIAVDMYQKMGYTVFRRVKNYYCDDPSGMSEEGEDAFDMRKPCLGMPRFLHPKRSGVHRLACLSLYHALLKQCAGLARVNVDSNVATQLVKLQFRKLQDLDSPTRIINALKAGPDPGAKTLDLIHSCVNGSQSGFHQLTKLMRKSASITAQVREKQREQAMAFKPQDPTDSRLKRRAEGRARRRPEALRPHPDVQPITSRPRPEVPGVRRIPVFVNARGVPYLRIKKPQPPSLSRALRSYLDNRWARIERRERLEEEIALADTEDEWDDVVAAIAEDDGKMIDLDRPKDTWKLAAQESLHECHVQIRTKDQETARRAEEMFNVVLREKELKRKEKEVRRQWWAENMADKDQGNSSYDSKAKSTKKQS
ncbi:hypothetical protein KEM56_007547 [Ascosphaera pollenicola]|nr:hypothetical protein KEM56_007547 [Ascosphaera pollenicola]